MSISNLYGNLKKTMKEVETHHLSAKTIDDKWLEIHAKMNQLRLIMEQNIPKDVLTPTGVKNNAV